MKKIVSIIIAFAVAFCLCLPAFAAQSATFAVNVVSESDTRAIVSIDYEGGSSFNCLDFEVKLSKRLSVEKCATGAGLRNFKIYADDLNANLGDTVIMSFNKDSNPIKFTFASISSFKAVNGKDLLTLTLKKTSADKLKADDVKLTVTNCGLSGSTADSVITVEAKSIPIGGSAEIKTSAAAGQVGTTVAKTSGTTKAGETTSATTTAGSSELSEELTTPVAESVSGKNDEDTNTKTTDKKKIVVVGAAALIVLAIIVVAVVVIAKKYKKEDAE